MATIRYQKQSNTIRRWICFTSLSLITLPAIIEWQNDFDNFDYHRTKSVLVSGAPILPIIAAIATSAAGIFQIQIDTLHIAKYMRQSAQNDRNRAAFVRDLLYTAFYRSGQAHNVMVFNLAEEHHHRLYGVRFYGSVKHHDGVRFGVWVFESGMFENRGARGWHNWAMIGSFKKSARGETIYFQRRIVPTESMTPTIPATTPATTRTIPTATTITTPATTPTTIKPMITTITTIPSISSGDQNQTNSFQNSTIINAENITIETNPVSPSITTRIDEMENITTTTTTTTSATIANNISTITTTTTEASLMPKIEMKDILKDFDSNTLSFDSMHVLPSQNSILNNNNNNNNETDDNHDDDGEEEDDDVQDGDKPNRTNIKIENNFDDKNDDKKKKISKPDDDKDPETAAKSENHNNNGGDRRKTKPKNKRNNQRKKSSSSRRNNKN